jgi:1-deoxy-D-xylulose-5-phosphate reductoisomerase
MMNKGLEVIEARWLFDIDPSRIEVLIHPQSVVHSMVEYVDGSTIAQLSNPDMRVPIAHALAYPGRIESGASPLALAAVGRLDFEIPDLKRFPCLALAYSALESGGTAPAILNAANEVAVDAFLKGRLPFTGIAQVDEEVLRLVPTGSADTLEAVLEADGAARASALQCIERRMEQAA